MGAAALAFRTVLILAALCVFAASFAMNGYFWLHTMAADPLAAWIYFGFSIIAGVIKVGVPALLVLHRVRWRAVPALLVPFLIATAYDVWSGAGYIGMTRDAASLALRSDTRTHDDLQRELTAIGAKLDALPPARALAVVDAEAKTAELTAGTCRGERAGTLDRCKTLFAARAELAAAKERDRLEAERLEVSAAIRSVGEVRDSRPHITQVQRALRTFGVEVAPATLENVWAGLMLAFIEFGPMALLLSVLALPPRSRVPPAPSDGPPLLPMPGAIGRPVRASQGSRARNAGASDSVLLYLQGQPADGDGWIEVPQRSAAATLGVSAADVNRQIARLEAAGSIRRKPGARVTTIALN